AGSSARGSSERQPPEMATGTGRQLDTGDDRTASDLGRPGGRSAATAAGHSGVRAEARAELALDALAVDVQGEQNLVDRIHGQPVLDRPEDDRQVLAVLLELADDRDDVRAAAEPIPQESEVVMVQLDPEVD